MQTTAIELVRKAFHQARASGRQDWNRMTVPVLKNRILTVTDGKFKEGEFGAERFSDFIRPLVGPQLSIDDTVKPPMVHWVDVEVVPDRAPEIRSDLWRAILDYSSNRIYVWDETAAIARAGSEHDAQILPTVTVHEFDKWRAEFAEHSTPGLEPAEAERVSFWVSRRLPTQYLPASLRGPWNAALKRMVRERLEQWFADRTLALPTDAFGGGDERASDKTQAELIAFRRFITDYVSEMSFHELKSLSLPASVLWRIHLKRSEMK